MQTKQMRSGREEVNVWIPKLTKQTCGIAETWSGLLPLPAWCLSSATLTSRVMPEQHEEVSCLHFRVVFPVTNVNPATLSILLVYVSLPFSGSSRDVISLVEPEMLMQGQEYSCFESILPWQAVQEEAECHPKPTSFSGGCRCLLRAWGQRRGFRCATSWHHYTGNKQQPSSYLCSL